MDLMLIDIILGATMQKKKRVDINFSKPKGSNKIIRREHTPLEDRLIEEFKAKKLQQ